MNTCLVIRGPAAVGKSTVAALLAKHLDALLISFDPLMKKHGLDTIQGGSIPARNFIRANELALPQTRKALESGRSVVFDGCFYHKEQLNHLTAKLPCPHMVFTLAAPVAECISRDAQRGSPLGEKSIRAVHHLVSRFTAGIAVDTSGRSPEATAKEVLAHVKKFLRKNVRSNA